LNLAAAGYVDTSHCVFAERGDTALSETGRSVTLRVGDLQKDGAEPERPAGRAVVGVDVAAEKRGQSRIANDVTAGDRAAPAGVRVLPSRLHMVRWQRVALSVGSEDVAALVAAPAEVHAPARVRRRCEVDLLPVVLTDVGEREVAGLPIEREAPRVPESVSPDLVAAGNAYEGIVGGDRVGLSVGAELGIDPQELAAQVLEVLRTTERVAAASAVARGQVEVVVGPELKLAAVVVRLPRVRDLDHDSPRGRVGNVRIDGVAEILGDDDVPLGVGVVDVKLAARRVVRRERHREETSLAARRDHVDGEKRG
jgi:hypothetical protein